MAKVIKRTWKTGRTKHVAYGYTLQVGDTQVRKFDSTWTKDDARDAMAARILEAEQAAAPEPPPPPKTFGEVADEYLEFKKAKGKKTLADDRAHLKRWRAFLVDDQPLAAMPITEVTGQMIAAYDRERAGQISRLKRQISVSSINRELATIRHLLRLADEWGYIPKAPRVRQGKENEGRLRFLERAEADRLLDACRAGEKKKHPYLEAIVTVALHTGMRRGEILGLTWERVDFSRGVLKLEKTKNGRRREVPMNQPVYAALTALPGQKAEGYVFRKVSGKAWGSIRTAFEHALTVAKIEDFVFHDLRHTCASWLVMAGRPLTEVKELLGHRTLAMTMRYAHLSPGRLRDAVGALESFSTQSAHDAVESATGPATVVQVREEQGRAVSSVGQST